MPTIAISPHARIGALLGVLLTALAGSAFFLFHSQSHPATVTPPVTHPHVTPPTPVHVVQPTVNVNPLLPAPLHLQLEHYPRVLVAFYNPSSPIDAVTLVAASEAAKAQHVPFIAVNLMNDAVAGPLTALLPTGQLLPNPGFAIYRRPGVIVFRSDGALAESAVAQAIKDTR